MRYTLALQGTVETEALKVSNTFQFDLRSLIPREKNFNSKFLLKSTFVIEDLGTLELDFIEVGMVLPISYNKSYPQKEYTTLGFATSKMTQFDGLNTASFNYTYCESECVPIMIDYPDISQITVYLRALDDILVNTTFSLILAFEEI